VFKKPGAALDLLMGIGSESGQRRAGRIMGDPSVFPLSRKIPPSDAPASCSWFGSPLPETASPAICFPAPFTPWRDGLTRDSSCCPPRPWRRRRVSPPSSACPIPDAPGTPRAHGHKILPPDPGSRYNPHSLQATCLRLPVAFATCLRATHRQAQTGAARTCRAVQFNPFYPAGPPPRLRA